MLKLRTSQVGLTNSKNISTKDFANIVMVGIQTKVAQKDVVVNA